MEGESDRRIRRLPVSGGPGVVVAENPLRSPYCAATENGTELTLSCTVEEIVTDAWVMEGFDPEAALLTR
jgi:hypothetical protein